jgi:ribosomal protein S8
MCRYCHQRKAGDSVAEVTKATSLASAYLALNKPGHRIYKTRAALPQRETGQLTIAMATSRGVKVSQAVSNALGNFNTQGFRLSAIL